MKSLSNLFKYFLLLLSLNFIGCSSLGLFVGDFLFHLAGSYASSCIEKKATPIPRKDPRMIGRELLVKKELFIGKENIFGFEELSINRDKTLKAEERTLSVGSKIKITEILPLNRDNKRALIYYIEIIDSEIKDLIGVKASCWLLINFDSQKMKFSKKYAKEYLEFLPEEKPEVSSTDIEKSTGTLSK